MRGQGQGGGRNEGNEWEIRAGPLMGTLLGVRRNVTNTAPTRAKSATNLLPVGAQEAEKGLTARVKLRPTHPLGWIGKGIDLV
jgi:hypothetical protein